MNSKYRILGWDTDFFGFKVAKINHFKNCRELSHLVKEMGEREIKVAYIFLDPDDIEKNTCLLKAKAFLADEKITYSLNSNNKIAGEISENIIELKDEPISDTLYDLAIQSSIYSRFRVDKLFGEEVCDKLYRVWIRKSAMGCFDDCIFVYKQNKSILGFITLKIYKESGSIGLIGVDSASRGKNIGSQLINKVISYFQIRGIHKIDVVTQKANIAACRFYEKNGFSISNIMNTYHLWI